MSLDLTSFRKALDSLRRAVDRRALAPADEEVRDAVVQQFEYSFELAWKMLKRQLEADAGSPDEIEQVSKRALFRAGGECGLIDDVEAWFDFLKERNLTAHTYNEAAAIEVAQTAVRFLAQAELLHAQLLKRKDADA